MLIGEWVGLATLILTNGGISIGIYRYFDKRIERVNNDTDAKISRIFQRFDEHKKDVLDKCVQKDMCKIMHDNNASNLIGLESRIEKRFDKLDSQITQLLNK